MIKRYPTRKIKIRDVEIGGGAPISVQSMTYSKTKDINSTLEQINRLYFAGADLVRVAVLDEEDAKALKTIVEKSPLPVIADIHFNYKLGLIASEYVDALRINPGNIGGKTKIKEIVKACKQRNLPIRIGVNSGSLEEHLEKKYGQSPKAMVESALWHIKFLEDLDFFDIKVSLKASDVIRTVEAYRMLRPLVDYPFHLGVTEAGTKFHATIKSAAAFGALLLEGIGDTLRVSITGELEEEIRVGRAILQDLGLIKGVNIVSCPTCGRIEVDLPPIVEEVEKATKNIKVPLNLSVMGCVVNALGEAKEADLAIACGKGYGLILKKGEIIGKYKEKELLPKFLEEINKYVKECK
ncbi:MULTISPECIES: flavodoxin-dependent (E)-4-hydroxy-3-methylbut-2-enyl-diphosphate synthase [unclassified Lebetimonas]|uniref:flavodoxin-dependent (E)-4-hydroxy-3-methylbut-2-enyl-diphosphate synthase n=1 Tax=unclassified Lebetimonas TaxID=2648158 RepID=UPI0004B05429|nr:MULTISPECIES: flavodoxin-dependent (E)-4-hydroxy-3-methylbut-2-enyl-diphosphate synthase [unclassified Lebetimonas]